MERQTAALRALALRAFPEVDDIPDDAPARIEQARAQRRRQTAATETAALRRARVEKADRQVVPQRMQQTAQPGAHRGLPGRRRGFGNQPSNQGAELGGIRSMTVARSRPYIRSAIL
ncbi:hypothetical protein [Streptomyces sp. NPDC006307]|uniref:hypothetical protein n=1 Tax=Streptomyces sp. NPDC006307 TaxID=3156748 RepID=UPI0033B201D4